MYEIEKGIPTPDKIESGGRRPGPFLCALRALDIGDSIKVGASDKPIATIHSPVTHEKNRSGRKFTLRTISATDTEPKHYRVWRVA